MDVHFLGRVAFDSTYAAMQKFTNERGLDDRWNVDDQLWICEHHPLFTQGLAGRPEHVIDAKGLAVISTDRGGQVTFHGPGQVVAYPLLDLKRAGYYVKEYVYRIEQAVLSTLRYFGVTGHRVAGAPGIYVRLEDPLGHQVLTNQVTLATGTPEFAGLGKIAALGIKVRRNCTYHGVALNVAMDLEPFSRINPCGYNGLKTVDLSTIGVQVSWQDAADVLSQKLAIYLAP